MINKMLGRERPTDTTPVPIYTTPDNGSNPLITIIHIAKTIEAAASFSIFLNAGGVYNETTALFYNIEMNTDRKTKVIGYNPGMGMGEKGDILEVKSHTASAFTFTLHGEVIK